MKKLTLAISIIGILILLSFVSICSYFLGRKQVVLVPPAPAWEKSKVIESLGASAQGKVTGIEDRVLTLIAEGDSLEIPIQEEALIVARTYPKGKLAPELKEIKFEDIKIGDEVLVRIELTAEGELAGGNLEILPPPLEEEKPTPEEEEADKILKDWLSTILKPEWLPEKESARLYLLNPEMISDEKTREEYIKILEEFTEYDVKWKIDNKTFQATLYQEKKTKNIGQLILAFRYLWEEEVKESLIDEEKTKKALQDFFFEESDFIFPCQEYSPAPHQKALECLGEKMKNENKIILRFFSISGTVTPLTYIEIIYSERYPQTRFYYEKMPSKL